VSITLHGIGTTPTDNGTNTADPTVVTPPASMQAGDLCVLIGDRRASTGTLTMSETGGQTWTALTQNSANTQRLRIFWCNFNGTWSANPSVTMGASTCNSAYMLVFRSSSTDAARRGFVADVALANASIAAPGSPYTLTITGITRTSGVQSVAIAIWAVALANTFGTLSGADWSKTSLTAQYRNTSGSDQSLSFAYSIGTGATGNVSQNESAGTAAVTSILSFKEKTPSISNKGAYLNGNENAIANKSAYLKGQDTSKSSKGAFANVGAFSLSNKPAYLEGIPGWIATSTSIAGMVEYGSAPESDVAALSLEIEYSYITSARAESIGLLVEYVTQKTGSAPVYLAGSLADKSNKPAYIYGVIGINSNVTSYIAGESQGLSNCQTYLIGSASVTAEALAYLYGSTDTKSNTYTYLEGTDNSKSNTPVYLLGQNNDVDSRQAYLAGAEEGTGTSNNHQAYLAGQSGSTSSKSAFTHGGVSTKRGENPHVIIDVDNEIGDLSEYNGTYTGSGGGINVVPEAALANSNYGLEAIATGDSMAFVNFTKNTKIRARFYFDPHGVSFDGDGLFYPFAIQQTAAPNYVVVVFFLQQNYALNVGIVDDSGEWPFVDSIVLSDAPHYIEFYIVVPSSDTANDGSFEWWVDGVSQGSSTSLDIYHKMFDSDLRLDIGSYWRTGSQSGTVYLDEIIINDDGTLIGPHGHWLKHAYLTGNIADKSSKNAYLSGQSSTLSSKSAYLQGQVSTADSIPAYLEGASAGTNVADNIQAFLSGGVVGSSQVPAYLTGVDTSNGNKSAFLHGKMVVPYHGPQIPVDDFNRTSLGGNWIVANGNAFITNNQLVSNTGDTKIFWGADSFLPDQYSEAKVYATGWRALTVRASGTGSNHKAYAAGFSGTGGSYTLRFWRIWGSSWGGPYLDAGTAITINAGDTFRFEVSGQDQNIVLKAYINGSLVKTLGWANFADQTIINTGAPGFYWSATTPIFDDWAGGSIPKNSNPAFLAGSSSATSSVHAYMQGSISSTSKKPSYLYGAEWPFYDDFNNTILRLDKWAPKTLSNATLKEESGKGKILGSQWDTSDAEVVAQIDSTLDDGTGSVEVYFSLESDLIGNKILYLSEDTSVALSFVDNSGDLLVYIFDAITHAIVYTTIYSVEYSEQLFFRINMNRRDGVFRLKAWRGTEPLEWSSVSAGFTTNTKLGVRLLVSSVSASTPVHFTHLYFFYAYYLEIEAISAYLSGMGIADSSTPVFLSGGENANSAIHVYTSGDVQTSSSINAHSSGCSSIASSIPAYLIGLIYSISRVSAFLSGISTASDSKSAFLSSFNSALDSTPSYTSGSNGTNGSLACYATGQDSITGSANSYLRGQDSTADNASAHTHGSVDTSSNIPAHTSGQSDTQDSLESMLSGGIITTSNTPAYLYGQVIISSNIPAFINPDNINSSSTPAFLVGGIISGPLHAFINPHDTVDEVYYEVELVRSTGSEVTLVTHSDIEINIIKSTSIEIELITSTGGDVDLVTSQSYEMEL
jgi:hypothetical protein